MTKTMTAKKHSEQLEKNKAMAVAGLRDCRNLKIGDVARQGDVYFHVVSSDWPKGDEIKNHQLAPGNTKGSRHIADNSFKVFVGIQWPSYINKNFRRITSCLGPVIVATQQSGMVTHPEHCNFALNQTIQITYQCDIRTMDRVRD